MQLQLFTGICIDNYLFGITFVIMVHDGSCDWYIYMIYIIYSRTNEDTDLFTSDLQ